ncbi:MAG: hypothetical protein HUJ93_08370, partial [Bacteroidales bacterium]|nr:hypothetical protein [Bacteroidales bacterium]
MEVVSPNSSSQRCGGTIQPNDTVIFFNYRNDRAKE